MAQTLYFIRHGQTNWNAERRMQGQWESELTDLGRTQARQSAETLKPLGVNAVFSSPLRRARDTAEMVAETTGLTITYDDRLKEWSAGDWSGHLYADVMARWPTEWVAWRDDMWRYRPPGAENFCDLVERGSAFLDDILAYGENAIAIVSHGFIGRAMIGSLLKLDPQETLHLQTPNDAFFRLTRDNNAWRAERFVAGDGPLPGLYPEDAAPEIA